MTDKNRAISTMKKLTCVIGILFCLIFAFTFLTACQNNNIKITYDGIDSVTDTGKDKSYSFIKVGIEMYQSKKEKTFVPDDFYITLNGVDIKCKNFLNIENHGASFVGDDVIWNISVDKCFSKTIPAYNGGRLYLYFEMDFSEEQVVYYNGTQIEQGNNL